jgi:hypothetical protein
MPLYDDAPRLIRANLEYCQRNPSSKPRPVAIGTLTEEQLNRINELRAEDDLPPMRAEVVFIGSHLYRQRAAQGYDIDEMLEQITSAMSAESRVVECYYMRAIENPNPRIDRKGKAVNDRAIFECSKKFPNFELFSVVPKGDGLEKS